MPAEPWTIERTEQKFEYARIHLEELRAYPGVWSNNAWVRAHEEAVLFHMVAAVEGTFQEMNTACGVGLDPRDAKLNALKAEAKKNPVLAAVLGVYLAERDKRGGWLDILYEMRNGSTHRQHTGRHMYEGNPDMPPTSFANPFTKAPLPGSTLDALARFEADARALVERIRATYP